MVLGTVDFNIDAIIAEINSAESAENLSFKNLIFEEYQEVRGITEFNTLKTGIKCGSQIGFIDMGNDFGFMVSAEGLDGCEYNECDANITTSVKKWDTHPYNCEIKFCKANMECAFAEWFGLNCDHAKGDQVNDQFVIFLAGYLADRLKRSHWRTVWFNNNTLASGTPLYGGEGIWNRAIAAATINNNIVEIPENANLTYAEQDLLDPQRGFEVYSAIHDKILLDYKFTGKNIEILTTKALAFNYLKYLRTSNQTDCCERDETTNMYSLDKLNIYGMPIKIVDEFDTIIRTQKFPSLDDGVRWTSPHRVIATYKDNIPFGTCDPQALDKVEVLYDPIKKDVILRADTEIGTVVVFEDELIVAI